MTARLSEDGTILHIHIPMQLRRRGGKKIMLTSDGHEQKPMTEPSMPEDPMVRALAKARRWQTMLESGEAATITELAEKEGVDRSYLGRTLRLNVLSPTIVEAILTGNYSDKMTLRLLREAIPLAWEEQEKMFGMGSTQN